MTEARQSHDGACRRMGRHGGGVRQGEEVLPIVLGERGRGRERVKERGKSWVHHGGNGDCEKKISKGIRF